MEYNEANIEENENTDNDTNEKINNSKEPQEKTPSKNIANAFDIPAIKSEIEKYDLVIEILPGRKISDDLRAMFIRAPYQGNDGLIGDDKKDAAKVALFVDYSTNGALAMSRSGADKETMIVISSIANKHIKKPFKLDRNIRSKL